MVERAKSLGRGGRPSAWWRAAGLLLLGLHAGCGPKGRIRDNPFAEPPPRSQQSNDNIFESANRSAAARDSQRGVSTSPVTDATPAVSGPGNPAFSASGGLAARPAVSDASTSSVGNVSYASIRTRLDKVGAKNLRLETDPATGKFFFRCEVANPSDPGLGRVFETNEPAANELDAMLAVTLSVEEWVAQQSAAPRR